MTGDSGDFKGEVGHLRDRGMSGRSVVLLPYIYHHALCLLS